jgi:hypothetical protein
VAAAIRQPGGEQAVQLKVAEKAVDAYSKVAADATTTLIVPSNMTEVSALIGSAMKMVQLWLSLLKLPCSRAITRPPGRH